jgi:hypothetical protein
MRMVMLKTAGMSAAAILFSLFLSEETDRIKKYIKKGKENRTVVKGRISKAAPQPIPVSSPYFMEEVWSDRKRNSRKNKRKNKQAVWERRVEDISNSHMDNDHRTAVRIPVFWS